MKQLNVQTTPTDMSLSVSAIRREARTGKFVHLELLRFTQEHHEPVVAQACFRHSLQRLRYRYTPHSQSTTYRPASLHGYAGGKRRTAHGTNNTRLGSIGEYLTQQRYSQQFVEYYIIPMVAAPWCIDPDEFSRDFPALPLIEFM